MKDTEIIKQKIYNSIKKHLTRLTRKSQIAALQELEQTLLTSKKSDSFIFPFYVHKYITGEMGEENADTPDPHTFACCIFGVYGWMAYTIYDSILDSDADADAKRKLLPVANMFHREFCLLGEKIFANTAQDESSVDYFKKYMDTMDSAQHVDVSTLRFQKIDARKIYIKNVPLPKPPKEINTKKSIGYILPSLGILLKLKSSKYPQGIVLDEIKKYEKFFSLYIDIMQTSDDIRDWYEDIKNGILTKITREIIEKWRLQQNENIDNSKFLSIHTETEKENLSKIFKEKVLPKEAGGVIAKIKNGLAIIDSMTIFDKKDFLRECLLPYEAAPRYVLEKEKTRQCTDLVCIPQLPQTQPPLG